MNFLYLGGDVIMRMVLPCDIKTISITSSEEFLLQSIAVSTLNWKEAWKFECFR